MRKKESRLSTNKIVENPKPTIPPPPYQEHLHNTSLPLEVQLKILAIVDNSMVTVVENLAALAESSANPLSACTLIRESCTVSATAIMKATLPEMTEHDATEEIERVHHKFHTIGCALADFVAGDQKVAVCTIWVDAVRMAVQQAASEYKGHRVNAWVFAICAMVDGAASNIMMELHYS